MGRVVGQAGTISLFVVSCGPTPEGPDARSEYFDVYIDDGIEMCAGQLDSYDLFVESGFEVWAGEPPNDFHGDLHILTESPCPDEFSCANDGKGFIVAQFGQYHELAHVMHQQVDGNSTVSIIEGLAEALEGGGLVYTPSELADIDIDVLFRDRESITGYDYGYLGVFTRYLLDTHGSVAYREFFRRMDEFASTDGEAFGVEFAATFDESLETSWENFVAEQRCGYDFWYCENAGEPIELPYEMGGIDCSADVTLGYDASSLDLPTNPYGPTRVFHVTSETPRRLKLVLEEGSVSIGQCGDCNQQHWFLGGSAPVDDPIETEFDVAAGTEVFIVTAIPGGDTRFSLEEVP